MLSGWSFNLVGCDCLCRNHRGERYPLQPQLPLLLFPALYIPWASRLLGTKKQSEKTSGNRGDITSQVYEICENWYFVALWIWAKPPMVTTYLMSWLLFRLIPIYSYIIVVDLCLCSFQFTYTYQSFLFWFIPVNLYIYRCLNFCFDTYQFTHVSLFLTSGLISFPIIHQCFGPCFDSLESIYIYMLMF